MRRQAITFGLVPFGAVFPVGRGTGMDGSPILNPGFSAIGFVWAVRPGHGR